MADEEDGALRYWQQHQRVSATQPGVRAWSQTTRPGSAMPASIACTKARRTT